MRKQLVSLALMLASTLAFATQPGNNGNGNGGCGNGQQTNGCGNGSITTGPTTNNPVANGGNANSASTAVGVGVGVGIGGAGGDSSAFGYGGAGGDAFATGGNSRSNATGGNSNSSAGGGAGGTGGVGQGGGGGSVQFNVNNPRGPAAPSFAPDTPTVAKSCRLYIGLGGASVNGSGSGGIPIGNDQTCLSVTSVQLMMEVNGDARDAGLPAPFGTRDILAAACKIEGMKETIPACQ